MMSMKAGGVSYGVGPGIADGALSPSEMHIGSPNSNSNIGRNASKHCGVCGDIAKSMHFGGLSCDSCKAFFRRSVQNNAYRGFTCPYERNCIIGISSRKACQYCRFEKCLSIGMEKGWVMSEEERRRMMDQRKEKKVRQAQEFEDRNDDQSLYKLSEEDRSEISRILSLYKKAYNTIPYDDPEESPQGRSASSSAQSESQQSLISTWMTFCKRLAYFFSLFRDFAELSAGDQSLLLKTALTSAGIIMGSVVYDSCSGRWAAKVNKPVSNLSTLSPTSQSVEKLVPTDLISRVDTFFRKFQQICPDETMAMILILVSLYSPELMGLEARERVQNLQERYIHILQKYVRYKFKEKSSVMFPKAIVSLADIRELADRTGQMRIQNRPTSMFTGLLQNGAGSSLSSPYSDLSFSGSLDSTSGWSELLRPESSAAGNDPIYQRIMKVIYQMHASSLNARTPTLLPLIIQILKKWAQNRQTTKINNGRAIMGSTRKAHRLVKPRVHRNNNHRSKRSGLKKESLFQDSVSLAIKEEVMDQGEDTSNSFWADSSQGDPYVNQHQTTKQPLLETYQHQVLQQQNQFHLNPSSVCTTQSPNASLHPHHTSISYATSDVLHHYPSEHQFQPQSQPYSPANPSPLSYSSGNSPLSYPQAISPEDNYSMVTSQNSMQHQSQMSAHASSYSPIQNMPSSQNMNSFIGSSPIGNNSNDSSIYASPMGSIMSPYSSSSSSSSSSPEGSNTTDRACNGELMNEDFTDTEFDVIMQLMERVSNFELLERNGAGCSSPSSIGASSVTDILPLPLLKELQAKLCSYNSLENANTDLGSASSSMKGPSPSYSPSSLQNNSTDPVSVQPPSMSTINVESSILHPQGAPIQDPLAIHALADSMEIDTTSQNSV